MAGSSHGHTPAAWTGVIIAFIGFCAAGAFMVMDRPVGFWASMGVVLLGGVVGAVMRSMGLGQPKRDHPVHETTGDREPPAPRAEPRGPLPTGAVSGVSRGRPRGMSGGQCLA